MFRKSYAVASAEKKNDKEKSKSSQSYGTMTLKKKDQIKCLNNQAEPEYREKRSFPKKTTTVSTKWVDNKTYKEKTTTEKKTEKSTKTPTKKKTEKKAEKK